jgi:hypothetical protein
MLDIKLDKTKGKYVTITDLNSERFIGRDDKIYSRIVLIFSDDFGRMYSASAAWIRFKGIRPLLYDGHGIQESEALGQLLVFLNANSTFELIGKRIFVYPDKKNFLFPVCYDETLMKLYGADPIMMTEKPEKSKEFSA